MKVTVLRFKIRSIDLIVTSGPCLRCLFPKFTVVADSLPYVSTVREIPGRLNSMISVFQAVSFACSLGLLFEFTGIENVYSSFKK